MNRNAIVVTCGAICLASVSVLSGTISPVAYGVGEATTSVTTTGIISTLTTLLSGAGGLFALFKKNANAISDGVELLRPVFTGKHLCRKGLFALP